MAIHVAKHMDMGINKLAKSQKLKSNHLLPNPKYTKVHQLYELTN